jgi:hypothetical protein
VDAQIIGSWTGETASGDVVRVIFRADQSLIWTVESPDSPGDFAATYSLNTSAEPREVDIFDFDMPQLKGFRFLGIYRYEVGGGLLLYGEPRHPNDAQPRPTHFSEEAIILHRELGGSS